MLETFKHAEIQSEAYTRNADSNQEAAEVSPAQDIKSDIVASLPFSGKYIDQDGDPFIGVPNTNGGIDLVPVRGGAIRDYVRFCYYKLHDQIVTDPCIDKIVDHLRALCHLEGEKVILYNRVGTDGKNIFVDGMNDIYKICPGRWGIRAEPIRMFRRFKGMKELPRPVRGGDVRRIFEFTRIEEDGDRLLFLAFLIFAFVPDVPHPILVLYGPQGSAKSSTLRNLGALIDPHLTEDTPCFDEREFMLVANRKWLVGLDNVSRITERFSDLFCKLVTGAVIAKRMLYTDEDLIQRRLQRVVVMNGINLPVNKPDILDRCILNPQARIPDEERLDEATLRKRFEDAKGEILGGCFDALAKAMEIYPTIQVERLPRLADFGKWGCAIAQALGYTSDDFLRAYDKNVERQNDESLDASPIAVLINFYFRTNPTVSVLEGTPTGVLRQLSNIAEGAGIDSRQIPNSPHSFTRKLQEIRATLDARGYAVVTSRGKERHIRILKPKDQFLPS